MEVTNLKPKVNTKRNKQRTKQMKLNKAKAKNMGVGPSFKNIRSLCNPQLLWQAVPQTQLQCVLSRPCQHTSCLNSEVFVIK